MPRTEVLALFGPTGIGKTAVAVALAQRLREVGERPVAVSADALQVYRGLEVLTGVATVQDQSQLEHRLISFVPVSEQFSAGKFAELAHQQVDSLLAEGKRPIVVGGTGLYLRAALADLTLRPPVPAEVRARWLAKLDAHGPQALHGDLLIRAPQAAAAIAPTDSQRIVRALELLDVGQLTPERDDSELWTITTRRTTLLAGLTMRREALYDQINARVQRMVAAGAEAEVRQADSDGASISARKALGFSDLLAGDVDGMQRRTRNYARRQLTWMRKLDGARMIDMTDRSPDDVAGEIMDLWLAV